MDHFYVISNAAKDPGFETARALKELLEGMGKVCVCREQDPSGRDRGCSDRQWVPGDTDCVLVLGGDGTLIRAARDLASRHIPLFGINLGTLGYLTEVDRDSAPAALEKIVKGQYFIEDRMMLEGELRRSGGEAVKGHALNDIVIARNGPMRVVRFNIYVNGEFLSHYTADGIIVSTPTGSTAYNLSAGGPLVEPNASIILLTPISPHTLNNRSIVLPADARITIEVPDAGQGQGGACLASFDGEDGGILNPGERIQIRRSTYTTRIVRISKVSFLEILSKKLSQ